jgi:hypothetical protein
LAGNGSAASTQSFASTTLVGAGKVAVTSGLDQNATVNLGAITPGATGSLNVSLTNTGVGVAAVTTTTVNTATGAANILGGYAIVNGRDWATAGPGPGAAPIAALPAASYSANNFGTANGGTANAHSDVSGAQTPAAAFTDVATLRFNTAGASTLTLPAASTNTLTNGAVLVTPNVANNAVTITGGTLAAAAGQTLFLHQFNTANSLSIGADFTGAAGAVIVKDGPGVVVLPERWRPECRGANHSRPDHRPRPHYPVQRRHAPRHGHSQPGHSHSAVGVWPGRRDG